MMLTLRGLPPDITKTEIRTIIQNKCSVQHVMLDELGREGSTQRVTVACMDLRDASAVMRGMNGAKLGPYMLTVEQFRVQPQQEMRRTIESPVNDYQQVMSASPLPPERNLPPWERSTNLFSRRVRNDEKEEMDHSFKGLTRMVQHPQMVPHTQIVPQAQIVPHPQMVPDPQIVPRPQIALRPLMDLLPQIAPRSMRPQELVQYPQTGRPGMKPYFMAQSEPSRPVWEGSSIPQNQMSDLNGFGLGTSSQAISTTRMPPWEEERLKRVAPPRSEFRERSPLARDFRGREERMRGRDKLRAPSPERRRALEFRYDSQPRREPERRGNLERRPANRSPPRDSKPPRKRPRIRSPRRTGTLNKIQRVYPESKTWQSTPAKIKSTTQPSSHFTQSKEQQHNSHGVVRYVQHDDQLLSTKVISWMEQATAKVVSMMMGSSPSPGTMVKPKYMVMVKALKEEIKVRIREILRTKTFENPQQLADFYFTKFPSNTDRKLLNNICSKIKMDPALVDEMIAESPWIASVPIQSKLLWNPELPAAAAALTMSMIVPKIDRKTTVPPSEKELLIHLRQLVYRRLYTLVKEARLSTQTANELITSYRKVNNQSTDMELINAALQKMKEKNKKYVGRFAIQSNYASKAKSQSVPAVSADEQAILESALIKRASSNIVIRAFTGKASKKAMPQVKGKSLAMFPIAVSLVHEHMKALMRQIGRLDMHPLDMITLFDQTYKPADINQIITDAKNEYQKLSHLSPKSLTKAVLGVAEAIERKGQSGITPITVLDDDTPNTSNDAASAANIKIETSIEGMPKPPQKLTKEIIVKKSIWNEYAANSLASELYEKHCSKFLIATNADIMAREKKGIIARLKPIMLQRIRTLDCDIKDAESASAGIAMYKRSYEESTDLQLLESVAAEVARLKIGIKKIIHEKKPDPANNEAITDVISLVPKSKSFITIAAKSFAEKAVLGNTGEEILCDEVMMKRVFHMFRGRCMRYVKELAPKQHLTLEEVENLYRSKHSEAEDIETASLLIRAYQTKNEKPDEIAPKKEPAHEKSEAEPIQDDTAGNFTEDTPIDNLNNAYVPSEMEEPYASGLTLPKTEPTVSKSEPTIPKPGPTLPDPRISFSYRGTITESDNLALTIPGKVNKKQRKRLRKKLRLQASVEFFNNENPETTKLDEYTGNINDGMGKKDDNTGNKDDNMANTDDKMFNVDDGEDTKDNNTRNKDDMGNMDDDMGNTDDDMGNTDDDLGNMDDNMGNLDDYVGNIVIDDLDVNLDDLEDY